MPGIEQSSRQENVLPNELPPRTTPRLGNQGGRSSLLNLADKILGTHINFYELVSDPDRFISKGPLHN